MKRRDDRLFRAPVHILTSIQGHEFRGRLQVIRLADPRGIEDPRLMFAIKNVGEEHSHYFSAEMIETIIFDDLCFFNGRGEIVSDEVADPEKIIRFEGNDEAAQRAFLNAMDGKMAEGDPL